MWNGTEAGAGVVEILVAGACPAAGPPAKIHNGRGGRLETALTNAGVAAFIYSGCDALSLLSEAHQALGLR